MSLVKCHLCPRYCQIPEGGRGDCRVRTNIGGELYSLAYGNPCAVHVDPIEKKPFFHILPGTGAFSIATAGCNLHCKYCQNWQISQRPPEETANIDLPPKDVVANALKYRCRSVAYTYSDPIIFYEYTYDTSVLAKEQGLLNLLVTAGYIEKEPLLEWCKVVHGANVDLKGITEDYYARMSSGTLQPVLDAILTMKKEGVWVEITNLLVPTWNDKDEAIRALCKWLYDNAGKDTPLHFSRFWPQHELANLPPTPLTTLTRAWEISKEVGLEYTYIGNVPGHKGNNTYCPKDNTLLIQRRGYEILQNNTINGSCPSCGHAIPGIWS